MAKIKIAVAGCLGRMGQELSKQIINTISLNLLVVFSTKNTKPLINNLKMSLTSIQLK